MPPDGGAGGAAGEPSPAGGAGGAAGGASGAAGALIPRSIMLPGGGGGGAKIRSSEMTGRVASSAATLAPSKQRQSAIMRMAFSPTILRDRRAEGRAYEVSLPERDVGTSIGSAEKCQASSLARSRELLYGRA